ncbi:SDR family NAD(P)-dependent oxidoreductase [Gordonia rubripertincta]|uniref:SDR family NAD(P)-dependent oxidoreductase n=1 Tax=Gordonia rubripertincta TaxID=36822 RepID=A0ABT4MWR6_GORRU|nr:SDR family NAD(P)-dependent oxidoreductase [Gordonia rubripertincta]MCZ4551436.1 SDR family NAD(P)-dependent oxidoreductase [Gordonia rubripertincta]
MRVAGAVGVVTGGGGGLGAGVVHMLVDNGAHAVILDLEASPGAALAESSPDITFIPTDVADPAAVEAAVEQVVREQGRIDLCVNAAGISPAQRVVDRKGRLHSLETFSKTLDVNLVGAFDVIRNVAGAMAKNPPGEDGERGLIVNVSSAAGLEGQTGQAAYTAGKGALIALTLQLARDLAIHGIRVMTVAPGIMDTPMLAGIDADRRAALMDLHTFPKRLGTPQDFAALVKCFMEVTLLNGEFVRLDAATRL